MQMSKKIHIRADDAGSRVEADRAILRCLQAGTVKNVSVLANGETVRAFAELLHKYFGKDVPFCIGLHFCLTSEWPDMPKGPLSDVMKVYFPAAFAADFKDPRWADMPLEVILCELHAQLERLRQLGLSPDYLDGHMGALEGYWMLEEVKGEYLQELEKFCRTESLVNCDNLPRVRVPAEALGGGGRSVVEALSKAHEGAI